MFRLRMCHIFAFICIISGSMLKHKAIKLLNQSRGKKWDDFARPENNTYNFAQIMIEVSEHALIENEKKHLNK